MSNRTAIELNHDFASKLDHERFEFMNLLGRVLRNQGDEKAWTELRGYGVKRLGTRHHTEPEFAAIHAEEDANGVPRSSVLPGQNGGKA